MGMVNAARSPLTWTPNKPLKIPNMLRHLVSNLTTNYSPAGTITRDPRKVERKKPGHVKARKMPTWVKR